MTPTWLIPYHIPYHVSSTLTSPALHLLPFYYALAHAPSAFTILFMAALCNRCGHYIFALWFLNSFFFYLFSSPNLSRRRLDVYHTSTQGVIKPLFCVLEDELLSASDELLRETGQSYHVVRSHNELNVAKVAIALPQTS